MKPLRSRTAVGRADLLRVYAEFGDDGLESAALAMGYERRPAPRAQIISATAIVIGSSTVSAYATVSSGPPRLPSARFFHVTEHRQTDPDPGDDANAAPIWLAKAEVLSEDACPPPGSVRVPAPQPLTRWSRLWPFLRHALGQRIESRRPDLPRLIDRLTHGEVVRTVPMHRHQGWSPRISILADYNRQTQPFHGDFNSLCRALERRHGKLGIERSVLASDPGRNALVRQPLQSATRRWQVPLGATPLLILSDLGLLDGAPETLRGWQQFGGRLRSAGLQALVLCPVPAALHPASLQRSFEIVAWDRHSSLRRSTAGAPPLQDAVEESAVAVDRLLALLAPAVLIEPPLLRAIRHLLPAAEADVLAEAMLWQHPDVLAGPQGFQFAGLAAIEKYQSRFAELTPELQEAAVGLILAHHAGLPESVRMAEIAACRRLAPAALATAQSGAVERWQRDMARTALENRDAGALQQWLRRHITRQSAAMYAGDAGLAALWALDQRERLARGETVELPPGVRRQDVDFFLSADRENGRVRVALLQRGDQLRLETVLAGRGETDAPGSPYAEATLVDGGVFVRVTQQLATVNVVGQHYVPSSALPQTLVRLTRDVERIEVYAAHLELTVSALDRPAWARALGRDARGLYAEVAWLGRQCRLDWQPPWAGEAGPASERGRWTSEQPLGVDAFGLFGEISVDSVSQRFRWIAPGRFRMGSPVNEPERFDRETPHEVRLSRGFWLADTACTQAFWQAVTGSNPSSFKDDPRNPVEQVSWDDVQTFIGQLQQRLPGLPVRLPSEAEWEYACRARTTTPFSFGDNITPEQVNYHGDYPYADGDKGLNRGQTVPVGSLPPNHWGLYEMHGNVYEWCADWFGEYPTEPQVDPKGPQTGDYRVLRGGSWNDDGRRARSAYRFRFELGYRSHFIGFRLALGPGVNETGS